MGLAEWSRTIGKGGELEVRYFPLKKFTAAADAKALREEIFAAIDELNAAAKNFSSGKNFSKEYLGLISQAEAHAAGERWSDAHRTVWEATFLVNRALETKGASRQRTWVAIYSVLCLLFLMVLGLEFRRLEGESWATSVFGFTYWRYPLMGAAGGVTIVIWGLIKHTVDLDFDTHYLAWYFFKPVLGAIMGLVAVLVILGGFLAIQGSSAPQASTLPLYIVAFLAGFSERFSIRILDRVMTAIFGGEPTPPTGSTGPRTPPAGSPPEGGKASGD